MYDICHPTYYNMSQLGCNDQIKLTTAFYVYMELCEVKRYRDVDYKYNEKLQLFYLHAKKCKNGAVEIFIPWPAVHDLSLDLISNIQQELETEKFTFVFKEGDTTSVYYCISTGMIKPIHPDETKILKRSLLKKVKLEREIHRNAANLYERALLLDNGENHVRKNINSLDDEIDDKQNTEELILEDIEHVKTEVCASLSKGKNYLAESGELDIEMSESKYESLEIENFESKSENMETEHFESKSENAETENIESKSENAETENIGNSETENIENNETENIENSETENIENCKTENIENIETENIENSETENTENIENSETENTEIIKTENIENSESETLQT